MQIYCPSLTKYERWKTRSVMVGDIGVGGNNPIRIQSMTTTDTMDTDNTVAQSIRMIENGCEIVRITAPSIKEAKNLKTEFILSSKLLNNSQLILINKISENIYLYKIV